MNPALQPIKNLLFDLGGVHYAIDYKRTEAGFHTLAALAGTTIDFSQAAQEPLFDQFEMGLISPDAWRAGIRQKLGFAEDALHVNQAIDTAWCAMLIGLIPGRAELLARLKAKYPIALLSNTNAIHWPPVSEACAGILPYFDRIFLSHELHLRKPNADIFEHALSQTGWLASETLFIEDTLQHIRTAQALGFHTLHLTNAADLEPFFAEA